MLNALKQLILEGSGSGEKEFSQGADSKFEKVQIATCSVLIEIANSDDEYADVEKDMIISLIKGAYDLDDDEVNSIMELSQHRIDEGESISVEFIDIINTNFDSEEKLAVLKDLWKLVLADRHEDKYELYYMKKIAKALSISDESSKAAELEVMKEIGL